MKKPKLVLTSIALLTFISACSMGAIMGVFAVNPAYQFIICSGIGVIGILAYHNVALMMLHIRFRGEL